MTNRKIEEAAADIDDAVATVEELQGAPDVDTTEKLDELHDALEQASDALDEVADKNSGS
jgi:hypothetical protein